MESPYKLSKRKIDISKRIQLRKRKVGVKDFLFERVKLNWS
ncbi:hypothetical protein LEP1GSC083_1120 [Leptospira interrogans serovar Pyrogenes str. L0374]|uniref:Uncharacterized protein n=1 Tax=Leptospira interrogans serovar Pyrogenes str. L0374 TaxID=1049928 RepID=M6KK12_LEPIR|nr:hypothetical protein LEP1GSC077_3214 [Leptospira interrogans str. C10069]EMN32078.1 hypothetical protein LEP1GSC083_1120 [Leptospira interrogans serovar Pyrogenes str. L0374]EMN63025.1 hypothetical protein LEP1GSC092_3312 [Leptospira interrogans serovar Pyrogenes str. R168]